MLPFVGVDGEGGDIPDASGFTTHEYTMLRVGERYVTFPHQPELYLSFLADQVKRQTFVSYFFDYDVTMMLRHLEREDLRELLTTGTVKYGPYMLGYRARKEFTIRAFGRMTTINDVGTFFQSPFVDALERWNIGTPEQIARIRTGKEGRQHFGELTPETIAYNNEECILLAELMTKFGRTCEIIGYLPRRWQGPGQLAKAMFRKHEIPMTKDLPEPPPGVWEMAQRAYYGGRFETSAAGGVRGPVEGWDINSAYPHAATLLPCLLHCQWKPTHHLHSQGMYAVSFSHRRESLWYGLPMRTATGSIHYPRHGSGWYWGIELESAIKLGAQLTIHHGWEWLQECDHVPFHFMHRLYSIRQGIGKTEAGLTLKLAMNSAYGVTAQSVGQAPYANPVWAGLFTAHTRARINHALAIDPYKVYMVATDGLFAAPGLNLPESDGLGGWERKTYDDGMFIVQPGVYFAGTNTPKTRGVPRSVIMREEETLRAAWTGNPDDGLDLSLRQFIGLRLGVARGSFHTLGSWLPVTKRISFDWSTKRRPHTTRRTYEGTRTVPYTANADVWTIPYDRLIGGNLIRAEDRLEFADQPDWAESLTEHL